MPRGHRAGPILCAGLVAGAIVAASVGPVLAQGLRWALHARIEPLPARAADTFGIPLFVAGLATALAWPLAFAIARASVRAWTLAVIGLMAPPALAFAGWGVARSPGTWIGDAIERGTDAGWSDLPFLFARGLAVMALSAWVAPLAAIVIALGLRAVPAGVWEQLRLDTPSLVARTRARARVAAPALAGGFAAAYLLMLGSAVPLHLAQVPTLSLEAWLALSERPPNEWGAVMLGLWPVLLAAIGSGVAVAMAGRRTAARAMESGGWVGGSAGLGVWVPLVLGVVAPLALLAWSVRGWEALARATPGAMVGLGTSLRVAAWAAAGGAALALAVAALASGGAARLASWVVGVFVFGAVLPGVVIGAGFASVFADPRWDGSHALGVVTGSAHLARFGAVAACVGLAAGLGESWELRDQRRLDGVGSRGYVWDMFRAHGPAAVGAGVVVAVLSLHEIEASVILQPPGVESFARNTLQALHFARFEEAAVAMGLVSVFGVVGGGLVCATMFVRGRAEAWRGRNSDVRIR